MASQSSEQATLPVHEISEADFYVNLRHWRTNIRPRHWPENLRVISLDGLALIGLDDQGNAYLNGQRLYTARRFAWQERLIAGLLALSAIVGAVAASCSAWADLHPL
ncbi:hypothetical protein [Sphingobium chungangianum]